MSQPTENTSLLERRGLKKMKYSTPTSLLSSTRSDLNSPRSPAEIDDKKHQHFKWLNKRTGPYDEDGQSLVKENTGVRVWNESYSSIDWIHDRIKEDIRKRKLNRIQGFQGHYMRAKDGAQAWIVVIITGAVVALIAWCINVVQAWMSDLKQGYCMTHWRYNRDFCCWGSEEGQCHAWRTWSAVFHVENETTAYLTSMFMYTAFGIIFSLIAAFLVISTGEQVKVRKDSNRAIFSKSSSIISVLDHDNTQVKVPQYETKTVYHSAGSGIPEVKVILGGFVIKGFLGIKTLLVKSVGMIFSTSAGLTIGKEGPFVHLACSAGNIACRFFPKFNKNESKRREILSAASASGVAVAFGAPIGGVLFSLEEVSYYFPKKTMIRSYCCAMIAAIVLKIMDPFGTGKIVLFQVSYDKDYHLFELVPFILCAILSGLFGTLVTHFNIKYQQLRKSSVIGKYPMTEVFCIMLTTALVSYWNPFARMSLTEFVAELFSECSSTDDNGGLCARTMAEIPQLIYLLATTLVIKMALTVITFGCPVPGGIFLPSLIIGAVTGRIIGLIMQYMTVSYPSAWPFTACAEDFASRGECIIPGVYAIVGGAAGLAGVTRTTISLVVIMFELTYSLTYALPIMISVMVSKWVSDAIYLEGIYDLLIQLKQYPYLETGRDYVNTTSTTITSLIEYLPAIDIDQPVTVKSLRKKLSVITALGYAEDGGFPILSGDALEGYIATSELTHGLDQLEMKLNMTMNQEEINHVPCYFRKLVHGQMTEIGMNRDLRTPVRDLLAIGSPKDMEAMFSDESQAWNDFSHYIDHAPLTMNQNTSMTLLVDVFSKLGARYVCVKHSDGKFMGIIHKRRLLAYLKDLDEDEDNHLDYVIFSQENRRSYSSALERLNLEYHGLKYTCLKVVMHSALDQVNLTLF
ncbi:hypothetical protein G6F57_003515 [Rhizopus arrhizus]|uniref:Chloride channel protein n=1 Tax=Rhizopus oryzae TaxID=64495 RepID=A0A9P7BUX3_RHIOR|nr:hypothetical protein G6F24_002322 [Rhizopus arrhizus]KAG1429341.1 hypothetical protein G6F58_000088 [Rhizopus delemar]KAG0793745.1 hypothetical protein G6F21_003388 [Rhizopus arrhizus]KAG0802366.1 hypothetical protein G6F22_000331 [Rhizopus arrhizus]KAG0819270.1 hypothetical protein G6F20_000891 [Rhizopus arrhizus]